MAMDAQHEAAMSNGRQGSASGFGQASRCNDTLGRHNTATTSVRMASMNAMPKAVPTTSNMISSSGEFRIPPMPEMMPLEKAPPKKKSTNISTLAANNTQTSAMAKGALVVTCITRVINSTRQHETTASSATFAQVAEMESRNRSTGMA